MPAATNKPQPYAQSPQPELKGSLQPYAASVSKNLELIEASIRQIIAYLYTTDTKIADIIVIIDGLIVRIEDLEHEMAYVLDLLDGQVNATWPDVDGDGGGTLNAATITAAAASITGAKTLFLKRGTWVIDADVDLSAMESTLRLDPGAVLEQTGSFTFKLPLNVEIMDQDRHFTGGTGFIIPKAGSKIGLDPRWWGALETGDSTDALIAFEDACFLQGSSMVLPAGTYGYDDIWVVRQGISGYNVVIQQLDATVQASVNQSTVYALNLENFFIRGKVTINSNDARVSLYCYGCDYTELAGLTMEHSVHMGIYLSNADFCWIHETNSNYVTYPSNPSTGKAADGFYQYSCRSNKYENCSSYSVERINFVSEGNPVGPFPSYRPSYFRCRAEFAHNMDHSTTEFNSGFWVENTVGCDMTECDAVDISNGVGQSKGFSNAFQVGTMAGSEYCDFNFNRCKIYGNTSHTTGAPARGFSVFGGAGSVYARVNIVDCEADKVYQGIVTQSGIREVNIIRPRFSNCNLTSNANSCLVMFTLSTDLVQATVDTLVQENCSFNANGAAILSFQNTVNCVLTIKNCLGLTAASASSAGSMKEVRVVDSEISFGATSRPSFSSPIFKGMRNKWTYRNPSNARLWHYTTAGVEGSCEFHDDDIDLPAVGWAVGSDSSDFKMFGGSITNGFIRLDPTTKMVAQFVGVRCDSATVATGAVQAGPNVTAISATGCIVKTLASGIPFQNYLAGPATAILTGNFSRIGIALTNWPVVAAANNVLY